MVKVEFDNLYNGSLKNEKNIECKLAENDGFAPYELLMGALASCFYWNFVSIAEKKRLKWTKIEFDIEYSKRDEVPAFLEKASLKVRIKTESKDEKPSFEKSLELAGQYCSVYQTLSKVGTIEWTLELI